MVTAPGLGGELIGTMVLVTRTDVAAPWPSVSVSVTVTVNRSDLTNGSKRARIHPKCVGVYINSFALSLAAIVPRVGRLVVYVSASGSGSSAVTVTRVAPEGGSGSATVAVTTGAVAGSAGEIVWGAIVLDVDRGGSAVSSATSSDWRRAAASITGTAWLCTGAGSSSGSGDAADRSVESSDPESALLDDEEKSAGSAAAWPSPPMTVARPMPSETERPTVRPVALPTTTEAPSRGVRR